MTLTLTAMRGYPGSGKSTQARSIALDTGAVVVCRDDLRMMLHGTYFSGKAELEDQVTVAERAQVKAFLESGISVVVDATHLEPKYLRKWAKLAAQYGAKFERVDMETPVLECIERDYQRFKRGGRFVGDQVIEKMAKRHPIKSWPNVQAPPTFDRTPVAWVDGLPECIIVDIDGTVAHHEGIRSPYDYSDVILKDHVDPHVSWLVGQIYDLRFNSEQAAHTAPRVIFVSGRDDVSRAYTEEWLRDIAEIPYDELHMRPTDAKDGFGNKLPDYIVKYDLFNNHIRGKYNVRFVLDDRQQVVDLWRALGLKCLQVQPGYF